MKIISLLKGISSYINKNIDSVNFDDYNIDGDILIFLIDLQKTTSEKIDNFFDNYEHTFYNSTGIYNVYPSDDMYYKKRRYSIVLYNESNNLFINNKLCNVAKPFFFNSYFYYS